VSFPTGEGRVALGTALGRILPIGRRLIEEELCTSGILTAANALWSLRATAEGRKNKSNIRLGGVVGHL